MRIFIAIPILENLRAEVLKYREFYPDLPIRWIEGENLHITLVPPWEEENLEKTEEILKPLENKFGEISVKFSNVSFGTNNREPRLIWATGKAPQKIVELKKLLEKILDKKAERNNFLLHLTIARFRPEDFGNFPVKNIDDETDWRETAEEFVIMRSYLSRNGADYEILKRFKL